MPTDEDTAIDYETERLLQLTADRPNGTAYTRWHYRAEYEKLLARNREKRAAIAARGL